MVASRLKEFSDRLEPGFDPAPVVSELAEEIHAAHERADDCASRFVEKQRNYLDSAAASELLECEAAFGTLVQRVAEFLSIHATFTKPKLRLPPPETCEAIIDQAGRTWPDFQADLSALLRVDRERGCCVGPLSTSDKPGAPLTLAVGRSCPEFAV